MWHHTHTKNPQFESLSIFFSNCQLPSSCHEWEEQEIPWAELIWVLVFHRSFVRRSWFVHIGPWCQWMHQVDPFEGCLKQTCLSTKTCKDHEGHISGQIYRWVGDFKHWFLLKLIGKMMEELEIYEEIVWAQWLNHDIEDPRFVACLSSIYHCAGSEFQCLEMLQENINMDSYILESMRTSAARARNLISSHCDVPIRDPCERCQWKVG